MVSTRSNFKQAQVSNFRRILQSPNPVPDLEVVDSSSRGKFGWTVVDNTPLPFIYRNKDEIYTLTRIIENFIVKKHEFLNHLVFSCAAIETFSIHAIELKLFNEINYIHCDQLYTTSSFNNADTLINIKDVVELSNFLTFCVNKLQNNSSFININKCGFYKLNNEAIVPFVRVDNEIVLPIFYFEGEVDNLTAKPKKISGWDVAYLKFCCKIQAIKESLYNQPVHDVLSLTEIIAHFPFPQSYDLYWPENVAHKFLVQQRL